MVLKPSGPYKAVVVQLWQARAAADCCQWKHPEAPGQAGEWVRLPIYTSAWLILKGFTYQYLQSMEYLSGTSESLNICMTYFRRRTLLWRSPEIRDNVRIDRL